MRTQTNELTVVAVRVVLPSASDVAFVAVLPTRLFPVDDVISTVRSNHVSSKYGEHGEGAHAATGTGALD